MITRNCNHFCNDICIRLTGKPIPNWINRLARSNFEMVVIVAEELYGFFPKLTVSYEVPQLLTLVASLDVMSSCDRHNFYIFPRQEVGGDDLSYEFPCQTASIDFLAKYQFDFNLCVKEEKQHSADLEKKYAESQEQSEERRKKLEDSENKVHQLQESHSRLEEKLQNLESESKVFRQQAVSMGPNKFLMQSKSILQDLHSVSMNPRDLAEMEDKQQKSLNEKQIENQELLIKCIAQHIGFAGNRPIAACIIYKCLLQWRSFEVERTLVFDHIIQTIGHAIKKSQGNNDILAYWLSNASTLLLILQRTLKAGGAAAGMGPQRRQTSTTLFGRGVNLNFVDRGLSALEVVSQVEAKYPALLFKQQLMAYVEKIYGMIRDNLKKLISPLLGLCIQEPKTSRASLVKGASRSVNSSAQQALIAHWQGIVKSYGEFLNTLKTNHDIKRFLVRNMVELAAIRDV
ncbi:hypothetical protein L6452_25786 [Arctium lappa]|uniref:Uncharacterized protein n=1 Tax=Arctium lappa TaxID=4217 RepID=A0ACB9ABN0_ARCLA|nr:hypothetical protein L6452_25786 [Arctium lappa]